MPPLGKPPPRRPPLRNSAPRKYPGELREQARRLVVEACERESGLSLYAASQRVGRKVGVQPDTLRAWFRRAATRPDPDPVTTTTEAHDIKEFEQENVELKRMNVLGGAAAEHQVFDVLAVKGRANDAGSVAGSVLHAVPRDDRTRSALCGARVSGATRPWPQPTGGSGRPVPFTAGRGLCLECTAMLVPSTT